MDVLSEHAGAQLIAASSFDHRFPPEHVIDGDEETKWLTTGSFPQMIIIQLSNPANVKAITTYTTNVKTLSIEKCTTSTPQKWESIGQFDLSPQDGNLQIETHALAQEQATFVKLVIESGYSNFITVHRVEASTSNSSGKRK